MFISNVDTPWESVLEDGQTVYRPELPNDPNHAANIKGWTDVTGAEGLVVDVGGGVMKHLYGGNYAKETGIQADYSVGRLGGSGDPDWLTIQIKTDTLQAVEDIDTDPSDKYMVLWTEEVIEETP